MSVDKAQLYKEHDVYGRHTNEMAKARIQSKLFLERHPEFSQPKIRRVPNTTVFGQVFDGSPGQIEGYSAHTTIAKAPLYQERLALRIKYAFKDGAGGNPDGSKSAFLQMNFRAVSLEQDLVRRLGAIVGGWVPQYQLTSKGALLYQPVTIGASPSAYYHRENTQIIVPQGILSDGDFVVIEDFFRDIAHPEDSGDDVYIVDLDWIAIRTFLGDDDVYMFEGEKTGIAVGAGATVDTTVLIDVQSPDVFAAKGILRHVEVVAAAPPGTSTNFTVEIYAKSDYSASSLLFQQTGISSVPAPYGLRTRIQQIIFKNLKSLIAKQLYARIINVAGGATTFNIKLRGEELK